MASITVSFELKDEYGNVSQTGSQVFENEELTAGSVGAVVKIKYDKSDKIVDFVGTTPRDRK